MEKRLKEKVTLVTGGSRGLGKAIAGAFLREGATVAIAARTPEALEAAADELEQGGARPLVIQADVTKEEDVVRMVKEITDQLGRLDILVNSAGIGILGLVVDFSVEDWDKQMAVNARGTFLCCREAVRQMLKQDGNSQIINVVSNHGIASFPTAASYGASKKAVMGLTRSLAQEVQAKGIRVSALCPMPADTEMRRELFPDRDLSTYLKPSEIAEAAVYMATRSFVGGIQEMVVGLNRYLGGCE